VAYFIECPVCQTTDLEFEAADSDKIRKSTYRCGSCQKEFIVEYKDQPKDQSNKFLDRRWKKAALAAFMLL